MSPAHASAAAPQRRKLTCLGLAPVSIMLAGIVVQLVVMIIYSFYGLWWAYKARAELRKAMTNLPNGRGLSRAAIGMVICSVMIILRGFWRSAELGDGFSGSLAVSCPPQVRGRQAELTLERRAGERGSLPPRWRPRDHCHALHQVSPSPSSRWDK